MSSAEKRTFSLPVEQASYIDSLVASGAYAAKQVPQEGNAYLAAPAVQQVAGSVQEALPAAAASLGPANTSQRIIHASQAPTRTALPPALMSTKPWPGDAKP